MSPLWYLLYLGLIGAGFAAAHVIGVRESHAQRLKTQDTRDRIQRVFDHGACQSYEKLEAIGRRIADTLGAHDGAHQFTMAQLDRTMNDANRAYAQFGDSIADQGTGGPQLQLALAEFCRKYSELVLLLGDVTQQSGHPLTPDERFRNWASDDLAFARELARLTAEPEFLPLTRAVRGFFANGAFAASSSLKSVMSAGSGEMDLLANAPDPADIRADGFDRLSVRRWAAPDRVH